MGCYKTVTDYHYMQEMATVRSYRNSLPFTTFIFLSRVRGVFYLATMFSYTSAVITKSGSWQATWSCHHLNNSCSRCSILSQAGKWAEQSKPSMTLSESTVPTQSLSNCECQRSKKKRQLYIYINVKDRGCNTHHLLKGLNTWINYH